jgi:transposase
MDREHLLSLLTAGMSLEQIGCATGLHATTIGYWIKKHGLTARGSNQFTAKGEPNRLKLERLVAEGATLKQIARELDRSISTVRYWLRKWQIERPRRMRRADPTSAPPIVQRQCGRHGLTKFRLEGRGYYRCLRCRQERVSEWRRRVKRTLIQEAGGRCRVCGYDQCAAALQFHHVDPAEKSFELSHNGVARNSALARAEAAKCVLLCANCHAEVEAGYTALAV